MTTSDHETYPRKLNGKSVYLLLLCSSPTLVLFACLGNFDRGIGAWICAELVLLVIWARWNLKKSAWFWATILLAAFLQVPFVLFVPWGNRQLTWFGLLPGAVLDYAVMYGCVNLVEKLTRTEREASV